MGKIPSVSVILSFRDEEQNLPELIDRLRKVLESIPVDFELIFVNDASTDNSLVLLKDEAAADKRIKVINMSRTFGVAECIIAGMARAGGDAVIYMDTDLQDPPEIIPRMVEEWLRGADVVYTVRTARKGESALRLWLTKAAYRLIRASAAEVDLTVEAGDFKLLSRRVADELLRLREKDPYLRGLVSWLGFKQVPIYYERQKRARGEGHFPLSRHFFRDLLTFRGVAGTFVVGITSFSMLPLVIFMIIGASLCLGSVFYLIFMGILKSFSPASGNIPGLAVAVFFLSGVQLIGIGVLGLYLIRVYREVRDRPRYIVESTVGLKEEK